MLNIPKEKEIRLKGVHLSPSDVKGEASTTKAAMCKDKL